MEFYHKPVLLDECIEMLNIQNNGIYVDGTLGGAGHSSKILERLGKDGVLLGLDRDAFALESSKKSLDLINKQNQAKVILVNCNFKDLKNVCLEKGIDGVDGILLDLGVSSHQFDEAERGFSYQNDAPLDMRMDRRQELTAEYIVNEYSQRELFKIIKDYGEERWASRIASFIVKARDENRIKSTWELVDIIKKAIPAAARREGPHPAKRTFQAIRIEVNNELGILEDTIKDAVSILNSGGRLCIISFHSLEDRIVKHQYQKLVDPCTCPRKFPICVCGNKSTAVQPVRKPILPTKEEVDINPRARSAKLRVIQKL